MNQHTETIAPAPTTSRGMAGVLLALGTLAGPFYIVVGLVQALTREGFDARRHALSLLSNGHLGWIQIANFLVSGALVIAGAIGCRLALRTQPAGRWGPLLLTVYGLGLVGAGVFVADPAQGFPPGSAEFRGLSQSGLLHFVFGGVGFYALIAACFVFARGFLRERRTWLAWFSVLTGVSFFVAFAGVASGSKSVGILLFFYAAVVWVWVWHAIVHASVRSRFRQREPSK